MPTSTNSKRRTETINRSNVLVAALCLIGLGLAGLLFAARAAGNNQVATASPTLNAQTIQVIEQGQSESGQLQQSGPASQLQQAAEVQSLLPGKDSRTLQPGSAVNQLLEGKEISP